MIIALYRTLTRAPDAPVPAAIMIEWMLQQRAREWQALHSPDRDV